ncbi:hypothetical protein AtubIFM56815_000652 [Aspergillus tubingensis]|uniref:trans-L-3-hydroxyproline dehydratase n=1 Tax=Aspergillus tubingensis TaxID=5068 RepID=A0A8H3T221_ASPTU|nr:proline racemase [Aspergillus tubingensis]GFN18913.1 proline racemase [Aspergillus tubingensis]GLA79848.1 hypothetical protein AtubIFM56815_000652 [Aspergillus tubingensis]GLB00132.1 hypothetical protein AtubIFM57143_008834 [Aspergillus tubingensis]GLB16724.1 hypothetical protein AtubIFM61612_006578 [Aspergillus tubingensis]
MTTNPFYWIKSEDWHTAGEPFRIIPEVPSGYMPTGRTVSDRRNQIIQTENHPLDRLRKFLSHEPRGHADMYGGFITPPDDKGAHFGVLFWHTSGFSTACGHGTIALGSWAVSTGLVEAPEDGVVEVVIDVPSGRVAAHVTMKDGEPAQAYFMNIASFPIEKGLSVKIPSRNEEIRVDLAFAGAVMASVSAAELGLEVKPGNADAFIKLQREIKEALCDRATYLDYELYAVIFFEDERNHPDYRKTIVQRNVTVYGDGQIDRSPCGSGTCARIALLSSDGRLRKNQKLLHHSIIGSAFEAEIESWGGSHEGFDSCNVLVKGQAHLIAHSRFLIDEEDPLSPGFILR